MAFKKGNTPWNKGKKGIMKAWNKGLVGVQPCSDETKKKMSQAHAGENNAFYGKTHTTASLKKMSEIHKGKITWMKGKHHTEETKKKISLANKGQIPWIKGKRGFTSPMKGKQFTEAIKKKMSSSHKGQVAWNKGKPGLRLENHPRWNGGKKLAKARSRHKRRLRGFRLISNKNPYNEPIVYHHIHPVLPYAVPCPQRIHEMFSGTNKSHFRNVNAMLGFRFEG